MSYLTLVLGESGTGKTTSLRNLDPSKTLLIQPFRKPLPFPSKGWREALKKGDGGNICVTPEASKIMALMDRAPHDIIVIDDYQFILARKYMESTEPNQFALFKDIGKDGYNVFRKAAELAPNKRVYILAHTQTDDSGRTKIKTLGKLLDEKINLESLCTTVLRTKVNAGKYTFTTHNSGSDTVKSPLGLFDESEVDNDLAAIDERLCAYYGIETSPEPQPETANA